VPRGRELQADVHALPLASLPWPGGSQPGTVASAALAGGPGRLESYLDGTLTRTLKYRFYFWPILGKLSAKIVPGIVTNGSGLKMLHKSKKISSGDRF
jgi:hypothetical protein